MDKPTKDEARRQGQGQRRQLLVEELRSVEGPKSVANVCVEAIPRGVSRSDRKEEE